jgi:hypothetical protein
VTDSKRRNTRISQKARGGEPPHCKTWRSHRDQIASATGTDSPWRACVLFADGQTRRGEECGAAAPFWIQHQRATSTRCDAFDSLTRLEQ